MNIYRELEIMRIIFKEFMASYNSRSLSKVIGMGHSGVFKIMKKLEKEKILVPKRIGKAVIYSINMDNPLAVKRLEFALSLEGYSNLRWIEEFRALEYETKFVIMFGSILKNFGEARDIDLLVVVDKADFARIKEYILKKNKVMTKRVHLLLQDEHDFIKDIRNRNKAMVEIVRTGRVLFGQREFVKLVNESR